MGNTNLVPISTPTPGFTNRRRELMWIEAGKKCHWCGCPTRLIHDNAWDKATIDHIIPRYKHGSDNRSNLVSACNRCNNRRDYEDKMGLPEGSMLGQYKQSQSNAERKEIRRIQLSLQRVCLTGDEKKAIKSGRTSTEDVLREQRDQALAAVALVRKEMKHWETAVQTLELQLKTMTVWGLFKHRVKSRVIKWLTSPEK